MPAKVIKESDKPKSWYAEFEVLPRDKILVDASEQPLYRGAFGTAQRHKSLSAWAHLVLRIAKRGILRRMRCQQGERAVGNGASLAPHCNLRRLGGVLHSRPRPYLLQSAIRRSQ